MTLATYNNQNYELRIFGGTLQNRLVGGSWGTMHPQMVGLQSAQLAVLSGFITVLGTDSTGNHLTIDVDSSNNVGPIQTLSPAGRSALISEMEADGGVWMPIDFVTNPVSSSAPSSPTRYLETTLSMSGNQIIDGSPATSPTGFVVLSQLTNAILAVNQSITAGDLTNAQAIAALTTVVNNLPAGITMPQVQAAIATAVNRAVADEIIDDATTRQLIVDAIMAQVAALDATIVARVAALEAKPDLAPRLGIAETEIVALKDFKAQALVRLQSIDSKNSSQDQLIAQCIAADTAQNNRLTAGEQRDAAFLQALTPVEVKIVNGAIVQAIGCAVADVTIDNSNTTHMQVSINLGATNAGKRRSQQGLRLMPNGTERDLGAAHSRNGEAYVFAFLKNNSGSNSVNLILN